MNKQKTFYKTMESLYVKCDDMFNKEDEQAYRRGEITVRKREVIDFSVGFLGAVLVVIFDIVAVILHFMGKM